MREFHCKLPFTFRIFRRQRCVSAWQTIHSIKSVVFNQMTFSEGKEIERVRESDGEINLRVKSRLGIQGRRESVHKKCV